MINFINLILILMLAVICISDFKYRSFHWIIIPILAILFFFKEIQFVNFNFIFHKFLKNLSFLSIQFAALTFYFSIVNRKFVNVIDSYIGLGDILFMIVLCLNFSFISYVFFILGSLVISVLVYSFLLLTKKNQKKEIPLAGIMSLLLAFVLMSDQLFKENIFYSPQAVISYFNLQ
jgi:hypothetical protein